MHFDEANINPIRIKSYMYVLLCVGGGREGGLALQIATPLLVVGLKVKMSKNSTSTRHFYQTIRVVKDHSLL